VQNGKENPNVKQSSTDRKERLNFFVVEGEKFGFERDLTVSLAQPLHNSNYS
jgi:hypothetical protein